MNIKRLIAREGLVLLTFLILSILVLYIGDKVIANKMFKPLTEKQSNNLLTKGYSTEQIIMFEAEASRRNEKIVSAKETIHIFVFILYPLYLVVRFIIWAIRTLKRQA